MTEESFSLDSFSYPGFVKSNFENDFTKKFGSKWTEYRKHWDDSTKYNLINNFPPHLDIELNYSCNLKCPFCTWSEEKITETSKDWFQFEDYTKIIDDAVKNGTKSIRYTYVNEPLLRPDLEKFIKYASDAGILDTIVTTNATLLTKKRSEELIKSGLTKLFVSIDAITEDTYKKVRVGGNYNTVMKNLNNFLELRNNRNVIFPKLHVSFVKTKLNEHEEDDFLDYWKNKADSVGIQVVYDPFTDIEKNEVFMPKKHKSIKNFKCGDPNRRLVLRDNGDVLPCCSFYGINLVAGNWKNESLKDIWNNKKMQELREIHSKGEFYKNPICKTCVESISYEPTN